MDCSKSRTSRVTEVPNHLDGTTEQGNTFKQPIYAPTCISFWQSSRSTIPTRPPAAASISAVKPLRVLMATHAPRANKTSSMSDLPHACNMTSDHAYISDIVFYFAIQEPLPVSDIGVLRGDQYLEPWTDLIERGGMFRDYHLCMKVRIWATILLIV